MKLKLMKSLKHPYWLYLQI